MSVLAEVLGRQFGAALAMLENAMLACPEDLWSGRARKPEFWYVAYHALFYLDFYLSDSEEGFAPPAPFTSAELDPAGVLPERPYTKAELLSYLARGRTKCRATIAGLTDENSRERRRMLSFEGSLAELLLYNLRHVQHHAGQLNLILRQETGGAPHYVGATDLNSN